MEGNNTHKKLFRGFRGYIKARIAAESRSCSRIFAMIGAAGKHWLLST
jgi:hypothetical protein